MITEKPLYTIGFDIGTTSVKGRVFDSAGHSVASFTENYPKIFPQNNWVEQDPNVWTSLIYKALRKFSLSVELNKVTAICLCSQVNTHVFTDEDGVALSPAIVWSDTRTKDIASEIDAQFSTKDRLRIWGFDFVIDASFSLSRAVWMERNRPDIWKKTKWVMSPKDFCNVALCGVVASDAFSSIGLVNAQGQYVSGLDEFCSGFSDKLPPLKDMFDKIGETQLAEFPDLKASIFAGTMDAWGNFIGSGVVEPGRGALICGTSSIVGVMSKDINSTKGIIAFPPFDGHVLHAGPTQAGSDAFVWFTKLADRNLNGFFEEVAQRDINKSSVLFLPHLEGERAPLWDPNARGTFIGLTLQHDIVDMGLAVLEGVAYSERQVFEGCCEAAGFRPDSLQLSGGASRNDLWSQLRSDCLGVKLERLSIRDSGVLGAALIANVGVGNFSSVANAAQNLVKTEKVFSPNKDRQALFDIRYAFYRSAYISLKPLFNEMA